MPSPNFLIAVFSQRISSFATWKARGINCLVSHEPEGGRVKKSDWEAAAASAGLYFLDYPSPDDSDLPNEAKQPFRLAFMQDDEPDLSRYAPNSPGATADGWTHPDLLMARYRRCKSAAPNLPVLVNFAGPNVTPIYYNGAKHLPYIATADWLAHDWYVKNRNFARYPVSFIGDAIDRLKAWSASPAQPAGKPQFAFIECSDQKVSPLGRCPTPDEVEEEIMLAVAKGAKGIIYFPQKPPPGFVYDAMPPEIVDRITRINADLGKRFNSAAASTTPPPIDPPATNPPSTPPPASAGSSTVDPNSPTLADVIQKVADLSGRLDHINQRLDALAAARFRGTFDLQLSNSTGG